MNLREVKPRKYGSLTIIGLFKYVKVSIYWKYIKENYVKDNSVAVQAPRIQLSIDSLLYVFTFKYF